MDNKHHIKAFKGFEIWISFFQVKLMEVLQPAWDTFWQEFFKYQ
jgi:hypothetical protein